MRLITHMDTDLKNGIDHTSTCLSLPRCVHQVITEISIHVPVLEISPIAISVFILASENGTVNLQIWLHCLISSFTDWEGTAWCTASQVLSGLAM